MSCSQPQPIKGSALTSSLVVAVCWWCCVVSPIRKAKAQKTRMTTVTTAHTRKLACLSLFLGWNATTRNGCGCGCGGVLVLLICVVLWCFGVVMMALGWQQQQRNKTNNATNRQQQQRGRWRGGKTHTQRKLRSGNQERCDARQAKRSEVGGGASKQMMMGLLFASVYFCLPLCVVVTLRGTHDKRKKEKSLLLFF